jgi:hypothetical protein
MAAKPVTHPQFFSDRLQAAVNAGVANDKSRQSIEWFRKTARTTMNPSREDYIRQFDKDRYRNKGNIAIGQMVTFYYDPKLKKDLPYYDLFPLVIIIDIQPDRIHALNLHYLPPFLRARLLDALMSDMTTQKLGNSTKINIDYPKLKAMAKYKWFKPCYKQYLPGHFRSKLMYIHPTEWLPAVFLPVANFQKKSQAEVWSASQKKVTGQAPRAGGREYARRRGGAPARPRGGTAMGARPATRNTNGPKKRK